MIEPQPIPQYNRQLLNYLSRWDTRLRMSQLAVWLPRGAAIGLIIGLSVAIASWLRPLFVSSQILIITVIAVILGLLASAGYVLLRPRSVDEKARYFDRLFGLKERSSTALELTKGKIGTSQQLIDHQVRDAVERAARISPAQHLPIRWRRRELFIIAAMAAVLALLLLLVNPQNAILAEQAAINTAIKDQINQLEQVKQSIQNNSNLSEQEKAELNKIIQDAINQLEQPNITQPEAVAALSKAQQELNQAAQQLPPQQEQAVNGAAANLQSTQTTQTAGEKLEKGDLNGAGQELKKLGQQIGDDQLTQEQRNQTADALDSAASSLQSTNPAASSALKRAADALRRGDLQAAQQALQDAADALGQQQQANSQSAQSQAAQGAAQQAAQGQQQIAQAGQQQQGSQQGNQQQGNQQQSGNQSSQSGQQSSQQGNQQQGNQQQGNQQSGQQNSQQGNQQGNQQNGQQNSGQNNNQQQGSQQGNQQGNQTGQQGSQQGSQQGNQQQSGNQSGNQQSGQNSGQQAGSQTGQQQGNGQGQQGNANQGNASGQFNQQSAGQGEGGAGNDVTSGQSNSNGVQNPNNGHSDGQVKPPYEGVYAPSFIGGNGGDKLNPNGQSPDNGNDPMQQGEFSNNPTGESFVPINTVVDQAAAQADRAMDLNRIPGALRGLIRDYFTSLQER